MIADDERTRQIIHEVNRQSPARDRKKKYGWCSITCVCNECLNADAVMLYFGVYAVSKLLDFNGIAE